MLIRLIYGTLLVRSRTLSQMTCFSLRRVSVLLIRVSYETHQGSGGEVDFLKSSTLVVGIMEIGCIDSRSMVYENGVSGVPSPRRKAYSTLIYDCSGEVSAP